MSGDSFAGIGGGVILLPVVPQPAPARRGGLAPPGRYRCTRCHKIEAQAQGCVHGPCPMELRGWLARTWFQLTGRL